MVAMLARTKYFTLVLGKTLARPIMTFVLFHLMPHYLCTKLTEALAHIGNFFLSPPLVHITRVCCHSDGRDPAGNSEQSRTSLMILGWHSRVFAKTPSKIARGGLLGKEARIKGWSPAPASPKDESRREGQQIRPQR